VHIRSKDFISSLGDKFNMAVIPQSRAHILIYWFKSLGSELTGRRNEEFVYFCLFFKKQNKQAKHTKNRNIKEHLGPLCVFSTKALNGRSIYRFGRQKRPMAIVNQKDAKYFT